MVAIVIFGLSKNHLVGMVILLLSLASNFDLVRSTPYCEHAFRARRPAVGSSISVCPFRIRLWVFRRL